MSARFDRLAWQFAVAFAWLWACFHLSGEWRANEQYQFGFGVPFLAAWMAWRRRGGAIQPGAENIACRSALALGLLALALGSLLHWHDPLWRFTGALIFAGAALLTGCWLYRLGGTPLLRRQIFPLCFSALAVPWPAPVENWIVLHLTSGVTDLATTLVNMLGVAALQRGNAIELAPGVVGLEDACSGIQSLQAMLMTSLFLGEFFSLPVVHRIALVLAGSAISFATNCLRVVALTLVTSMHGQSAAAQWHDFIGGTATVLAFGLLLAAAFVFSRGIAPPAAASVPQTWPCAGREGGFIFSAVLAIPLAAWAWSSRMNVPSGDPAGQPRWTLTDRRLPAGWKSEAIAPSAAARTALRFADWQAFQLRTPEGAAAQVIRLAWKPGARLPGMVSNHTPAVCMPSAGWAQTGPPFLLTLEIHGAELPCVVHPFVRDDARLLVLQSQSAGARPELRFADPAQIPGGFRRLSTLWREPLRQITGELLLYMPDPGDSAARKKNAAEIFNTILAPELR